MKQGNSKPKFLIVDDHEDIRTLVEATLNSYGCECEMAVDGQDALEKLATEADAKKFDAIFLDLMMPRLSGYEVIERLKQWPHTREIPVIMLTAKSESDDIIEGYKHGADYYIPKPFNRQQIAYGLDMIFGANTDSSSED